MQQTLTYPNGPRRGLVAGLAVSILLHALLLALWRTPEAPPMPPETRRWAQPLTVRILPPPPPPQPVARGEPPRQPVAKAEKPPARTPPPARAAPERDREPDSTAEPAITVVPPPSAEPAPAPADGAPKFDRDAARAAARSMANDLDVPSQNWAAEKLKKAREREETENERLGRNIANSARPDCKTAYAGAGLLAPLLMLMDKKDSGCKW